MFRMKFAYLNTADVTRDFWFGGVIHLYCGFSTFCKLNLAKYMNFSRQFNHNTNMIPITGLSNTLAVLMLGAPGCQEGVCGLKPA